MKKYFSFFFLLISFQAFGNMEIMTVKERVRLSLWFEGLESESEKLPKPKVMDLPGELEIPLKKIH